LVWFFSPPHDLSKGSAVPQMRERGLRSVLVHTSRPMTKQMWCCWAFANSQPKRPVM
jgi:hypothetical protein